MKKIYHLSTCNTCQRILKELAPLDDFELQDIKSDAITERQVDEMKGLAGSYEALFSKRARLYKERNLKEKSLTEADFRTLILEHYTFLKRPVILADGQLFAGNSKQTIEAARKAIHSS